MMESLLDDHLQRGDSLSVVSLIHFEGLNHMAVVQLDLLVTKLLSRSEFHKVSILLKALEHLPRDRNQESVLVRLGLPAKVCFWFQAVSQRLTSDPPTETLHCLTESFYDYFLCLSQTSLPVHQLSAVLTHLTELALKPETHFSLGLEAIRTFNAVLDCLSLERRKMIQLQRNQVQILSRLSTAVLTAGDYELQVSLTEALCRLTPRKKRPHRAHRWFSRPDICSAFCDIRDGDFELDCRRFLNFVNSCRSDQMRIRTFSCRQTFLGSTELFKPKETPSEPYWIDFNTGSKSVTFFTDDPQSFLWSSVHLSNDNVDQYSIQIQNGKCTSAGTSPVFDLFHLDCSVPQSVLRVHLIYPITHLGKTGHTVKIHFNPEDHGDLEECLKGVFLEGRRSSEVRQSLRVLPLSPSNKHPSSEPRRKSRAETLFDLVVPSTASYQSGVLTVPDPNPQEGGGPPVIRLSGKRSLPDSGFLTDRIEDGRSPKLRRGGGAARSRTDTSVSPEPCSEDGHQSWSARDSLSEGPQRNSLSVGFTELVQNIKGQLMESWQNMEDELQKPLSQCQPLAMSLLRDVHHHRTAFFQSFDQCVSDHQAHFLQQSSVLPDTNPPQSETPHPAHKLDQNWAASRLDD